MAAHARDANVCDRYSMDIKRRVIEPIWLTVLKNYNFVALETRALETMILAVTQVANARSGDARGVALKTKRLLVQANARCATMSA